MFKPLSLRWLRAAVGSHCGRGRLGRRTASARRAKRLDLERLEGREMMSAGGLASLFGSVLPASTDQSAGILFRTFRDAYEPDNVAEQAKRISTGGRAELHTIHQAGDVDWVKFTLTRRSNVLIDTSGRAGNTEMALFGPDSPSTQIAYNNGNGGMARIDLREANALESGTYYVQVSEFGRDATINRYLLSVRATPAPLPDGLEFDDTWQQANPIVVNAGPQGHNLHVAGDVDWAKFELAAAADVVIETRGAGSGDTRMWLYGSNPDAASIDFDNNDGVGSFSVIVRGGGRALAAGTYYVKIDEAGHDAIIPNYTLSVTALQPGDVLLTQGKDGLSKAIRLGEAIQLDVPFAETFSHSAIYVGHGKVAEMVATGFARTPLARRYAESQRVDILRDVDIGQRGPAIVEAAMKYAGTPYAFTQIGVFATAVLFPWSPRLVTNSPVYDAYERRDSGPRRQICSEFVALAFDDALLPIDVELWPTFERIGDQSKDFRMDFTSPTMFAVSPDLRRLNA